MIFFMSETNLMSQTLFSYGKHKVDKQEFLDAYHKNNLESSNLQSLHDYLDLYIAFKLKVQAARDQKLDTLSQQKADLLSFRQQIEADYLTDKKLVQSLIREAFLRSQKDIRISHIFISFGENDSFEGETKDTLTAFKQISKAYAALKNGENFSEIALACSADPSVSINKGDIGFITVFSLPYEFENIVYSLKEGEFSASYKSSAGYHIFKKTEERKAWGKVRVAQILLGYSPHSSQKERLANRVLADSLYNAIRQGTDFSSLAKKYSSERNAYETGGVIPDINVGRYDPVFEKAVFSLNSDGEVSLPVETEFGIHILKRIRRIPVSDNSQQADRLFKEEVIQDGRIVQGKDQFTQHILNTVNYKKRWLKDTVLWQVSDSFLWRDTFIPQGNIAEKTVLFSVDREDKTVVDWLEFLRSVKNKYLLPFPYADLMKQFVVRSATSYYQNNLELYNADFRNKMNEFSDGNLLFEIMEREVWSKAAKDNEGLKQYYEKHLKNYVWGPSAGVIFITTADSLTAVEVIKDIRNYSRNWRSLTESTSGKIIADSTRFELEQIPGADRSIQPGYVTKPVENIENGSFSFMYITKVYPQREQKSFEEARGTVINDYQIMLEEAYIQRLKRKYPVRINEKVLNTLAP